MLDSESVSLQDLLSGSLKSLERKISGKRIRIVRQIDPTTPRIQGEQKKLQKVIESILAEAAAGTDEGGRIRVCLKHNRNAVMVSIKDQGTGMESGDWETRLSDESRGAVPGAPWPLARCQETMESHGGKLFANAQAGKGITYYLTFAAPHA